MRSKEIDPFAAEIAKAVWALSPLKPELLRPEPQPAAVVAPEKAVTDDDIVLTVDEFCERNKISRSNLYGQWKRGVGPAFFKAGASTRITRRAEREWHHEREEAARTEAA